MLLRAALLCAAHSATQAPIVVTLGFADGFEFGGGPHGEHREAERQVGFSVGKRTFHELNLVFID